MEFGVQFFERCKMPTQSLPAASLRTVISFPDARLLLRVANYLICMVLWPIGRSVFSIESSFFPELREALARGQARPRGDTEAAKVECAA